MSEVFAAGDNQDQKPDGSFVDQLVEAKGEQWKDVEVIAKGKIEADQHIERLEAQLAEATKSADRTERLEAALAALEKKAAEPATAQSPDPNSGADPADTKQEISEEQIQSLVEKAVTSREQAATAQQNLTTVNTKLTELYGDDATKEVEKRAGELGMSMERLQELASESPTAFLALIGEEADPPATGMSESTINTSALPQSNRGKKNNSYYMKMLKDAPDKFNSAAIQNEMLQQRMKMGEDFYK